MNGRKLPWSKFAKKLYKLLKLPESMKGHVFDTEDSGEPSSVVRVWENLIHDDLNPDAYESIVRNNIVLQGGSAFCIDRERGIREIDLADPNSIERIIEWMILVGISPPGTKWVDK